MSWLVISTALAAPGTQVVDASGAIVVDGVLDEADWQRARPVTEFTLYQPREGGPPPGRTEVRFLQDDKYLYVGITVVDADYPIRARISPREDINADDQVGIYLDTFGDQRTGYVFYFNPLGIQQDTRFNNDNWTPEWNAVYKSRGRVVKDGFELEVAFPWRSLKYPAGDGSQTWGLIATRKIPAEGNFKYGHPTLTRNQPQWFSQAAPLTNVKPPEGGSGLELVPQLTAKQGWFRRSTEEPLEATGVSPLNQALRPSLDVRYGITNNLGLAGTLNPDFSQVEDDITPIALNQRFAFFFPERRSFFLDGQEYFQDTAESLYSRSIVEPAYGVKLSGKQGDWAIGALQALDGNPAQSVSEFGTPGFSKDDVDGQWASNAMVRVRRDMANNGTAGITFTDKRLIDPETLQAGAHYSGFSLDAVQPLEGRWLVRGRVGGSTVDAPTNDDQALTGLDMMAEVAHPGGKGVGFYAFAADRTPGYRQEMGFLPQTGLLKSGAGLDYTFESVGSFDQIRPGTEVYIEQERNGDWLRWFGTNNQFQSGVHFFYVGAGTGQRSDNGVEIRDLWATWTGYEADLGRFVSINPELFVERTFDFSSGTAGTFWGADLETTIRPTQGVSIDGLFRLERLKSPATDSLANRARIRLQWQFTRELGLRTIVEHTDGTTREGRLLTSVLLNWLLHPGTAAWLGYTEVTDLADGPKPLNRSVFAKASFLFRP